jgi:hypothetical protein
MQFLLDRRVNFIEHVKKTRFVAQKVSCQSNKWLWSYELKQQLFCSLGNLGSQKNFLFFSFFGLNFFHRFSKKLLNIAYT